MLSKQGGYSSRGMNKLHIGRENQEMGNGCCEVAMQIIRINNAARKYHRVQWPFFKNRLEGVRKITTGIGSRDAWGSVRIETRYWVRTRSYSAQRWLAGQPLHFNPIPMKLHQIHSRVSSYNRKVKKGITAARGYSSRGWNGE